MDTPQSVTSENKARLARAIDNRASEPGWSYKRIADESGVDVVTINAWRKGNYKGRPFASKLRGLDRALGYALGSCEAILDGRDPTPASMEDSDPAIARIENMRHLSREQKDLLIGNLRDVRRATLARAEELNKPRRSA